MIGKEEIRSYWSRQWKEFDPHVEPIEVIDRGAGKIDVRVHQLVKSLGEDVLSDSDVWHSCTIADGLIERMDIERSEAGSEQNASSLFSHHHAYRDRRSNLRASFADRSQIGPVKSARVTAADLVRALEANRIIGGVPEPLLAGDVAFRRLNADMAEQKLDLFLFSSGLVTQTCAGPREVMRRQSAIGTSLLYYAPNHLGAESVIGNPACFVDCSRDCTRTDLGS